jgi:uncharacterized RDD family membrane protein YckC
MTSQYCSSCSNELMITMRVCPYCGSKSFSPTLAQKNTNQPNNLNTLSAGNQINNAQRGSSFKNVTPAHYGKRFIASVIDTTFIAVLGGIFVGVAFLIGAPFSATNSLNPLVVLMFLLSLFVPYVYYTITHGSEKKATFGKLAMGLMLVTNTGEQVTKVTAFLRVVLTTLLPVCAAFVIGLSAAGMLINYTEELHPAIALASLIGILIIYIGPFATIFFNEKRQTLFDLICKTYVINKPTN